MLRFSIRSWIRELASGVGKTLASSAVLSKMTQLLSLPRTSEGVNGARFPADRGEFDEILAALAKLRAELRADAKKLTGMAHRYQAVGKIDQSSLNSLATVELRKTHATEEAARLEAFLALDDYSARKRLLEIARDLREAGDTINRALHKINKTRQLIIDGNFFR